MPKQKTHKSVSKKLTVRNSGSIRIERSGANHNSGKKPRSFNRDHRKGSNLSEADKNRYKKVL